MEDFRKVLCRLMPQLSQAAGSCESIETFKIPARRFIDELVKIVFPGENFILSNINQPQEQMKRLELKDFQAQTHK